MPPYLRLMDSEPWRKHWNSFFMDSSLMPMPVSRMLTRTSCLPAPSPSSMAGLQEAWITTSPDGVNFTALARMLASTCRRGMARQPTSLQESILKNPDSPILWSCLAMHL